MYISVAHLCFCLGMLALWGCCLGPRAAKIPPPKAALDEAVRGAEGDPLIALSDSFPEQWWTLFDDDQLSAFIRTAFANNPTLKDAEARILQAAYQADLVRADLYPNLTWNADVSRQKLSKTGLAFPTPSGATGGILPSTTPPFPPPSKASGIPEYFTQWETYMKLTFELDLWEKNLNNLKAALGVAYADLADAAYSRLQLGISLAQVYFQLQVGYKRYEVAIQRVVNRVNNLNTVRERVKWNLDDDTALAQAEYGVAQAEQMVLEREADIVIWEHQLKAYLADGFKEKIEWIEIQKKPLPIVPLPKALPLHLISRRPDIRSQLWLIYSAGKQIEVAKAGFYPDFNLTAFFGFQTLRLHQLFLGKSSFYNIDPAVSLPIFDGGRLQANLQGAGVNYDRAIYEYNQLVINAAREVLDGISLVQNSEEQLGQATLLRLYQEKINHLSEKRETGHLNSNIQTLATQSDSLSAQDQELVALGQLLHSILLLIKALGGGYDASASC